MAENFPACSVSVRESVEPLRSYTQVGPCGASKTWTIFAAVMAAASACVTSSQGLTGGAPPDPSSSSLPTGDRAATGAGAGCTGSVDAAAAGGVPLSAARTRPESERTAPASVTLSAAATAMRAQRGARPNRRTPDEIIAFLSDRRTCRGGPGAPWPTRSLPHRDGVGRGRLRTRADGVRRLDREGVGGERAETGHLGTRRTRPHADGFLREHAVVRRDDVARQRTAPVTGRGKPTHLRSAARGGCRRHAPRGRRRGRR